MSSSDIWSASLRVDGTASAAQLAAAARLVLERPVEHLLAMGGDGRQVPSSARNAYGFGLSDLDPIVRGSSCTATPPDRVALSGATTWRAQLLDEITRTSRLPGTDELRAPIVHRILRHVGLSPDHAERVVLSPSGTDTESLMASLSLATSTRPLRNVLLGSLEAGSGTVHAATGRYFSARTPFRADVAVGEPLTGFPVDRVTLVDVELRDGRGRARRPFDVEAEIEAHVEDAMDCREQVLVHVMAGSKTDLRYLDPEWVSRWQRRYPHGLRIVVDAAQARMSAPELRAYLAAGAAISFTGSKALCGPPFSGVLLLDDALVEDIDAARSERLPSGLADLFSATDLPTSLRPMLPDAEPVNLGLLARWHVALDEADRLAELPAADRATFTSDLVRHLTSGLEAMDRVRLVPTAGDDSTILAFLVLDAAREPCAKAPICDVYASIVETPGVHLGQPVELCPGGPAALRFAIGATTVSRALAGLPPGAAAIEAARTTIAVLDQLLPHYATL
jgi:hypothetical protein